MNQKVVRVRKASQSLRHFVVPVKLRTSESEGVHMHIPHGELFASLGQRFSVLLVFAIVLPLSLSLSPALCTSAKVHPVSLKSQVHKSHDLFVMIFI